MDALVIRCLVGVGFTLTFGVFQSYYDRHEQFARSKNIAVIGTVMTVRVTFSKNRLSALPAQGLT
jgi:hypothetical protein